MDMLLTSPISSHFDSLKCLTIFQEKENDETIKKKKKQEFIQEYIQEYIQEFIQEYIQEFIQEYRNKKQIILEIIKNWYILTIILIIIIIHKFYYHIQSVTSKCHKVL